MRITNGLTVITPLWFFLADICHSTKTAGICKAVEITHSHYWTIVPMNPKSIKCIVSYKGCIWKKTLKVKNVTVWNVQYNGCWWHADAWSHGIGGNGIDLASVEHTISHVGNIKICWVVLWMLIFCVPWKVRCSRLITFIFSWFWRKLHISWLEFLNIASVFLVMCCRAIPTVVWEFM